MDDNQAQEDVDGDVDNEFILSLCWDSGKLAATCYNLVTLDLMIMNETIDLRPDHTILRNIFRQIEPDYLVATGQNYFLSELIALLNLPEDTDIQKYKIAKGTIANASASNISFYPYDRKNLVDTYRSRIYNMSLPGLSAARDRKIFVDSLISMNEELVIIALGNLLRYLSENKPKWRHVYLLESDPIISSVDVFRMEVQVLLDETTFNSLNIFSNAYHPSSFKAQIRRDGLSIFNMINQCRSSVGVQELKKILNAPTRDIKELKLRHSTVEWLLKPENRDFVLQLMQTLKGVRNINAIMGRIIMNHGRTADWKPLTKTIYSSFRICELSASLNAGSIRGTLLEELASFADQNSKINQITVSLDAVVDIESTLEKKRFITKVGVDVELDEQREELQTLRENFMDLTPDQSLSLLSSDMNDFRYVFFPELGFVIGTKKPIDDTNVEAVLASNIELLLQTVDATYFRTPNCLRLNGEYEQRLSAIIEREMAIFERLIKFINEEMAELNDIMRLCAKLDVLISFASASAINKFVRPKITREKRLEIKNGRHPLVEQITQYIPSTTVINSESQNFINVIMAPNASGKSVYMKQIAIICYLAHIGMFVPAEECTVSLLSSVYARIYTPESLYQGESAFLADLQQLSKVVMFSDNRSLILIDEFGKGTNHKDGLAVLTAAIEELVQRKELGPIAFIATHYQQISELIQPKGSVNLKTITTQKNQSGVFQSLYEITDGSNNQNFSTEFPESIHIMDKVFKKKKAEKDFEKLTENYNFGVKALAITLVKQYMQHGHVSQELVEVLHEKTDLLKFFGDAN